MSVKVKDVFSDIARGFPNVPNVSCYFVIGQDSLSSIQHEAGSEM